MRHPGGVLLAAPDRRWECPRCGLVDTTPGGGPPQTRMHTCRALGGITAPMVPAGTRAEMRAVLREDYLGGERVQTDDRGRPVMAVVVERDDGQDCAVLAPLATSESD